MRTTIRIFASTFIAGLVSAMTGTSQEKDSSSVFKGHTDAVYTIAQSPDGKLVFTGGFDRTVRVWDAATAKQIRSYGGTTGHQSLVLSIASSPNGEMIASGGSDNSLFLWSVPLRNAIREFSQVSPVVSHALSTDGKLLAAISEDGTIRAWQSIDGKLLKEIPPTKSKGVKIQFSGNNQQVVAAYEDGFIRWFNLTDGKQLGVVSASNSKINGLFSSGSNQVFSTDDDKQIKLWQTPSGTGKLIASHNDAVTHFRLSSDYGTVVSIGNDRLAKAININSGSTGKETALPSAITASALFPNGSIVAFGQPDGKVVFWNRADGKIVDTLAASSKKVIEIAIHPTGNSFVSIDEDGNASAWPFPIPKPMPPKEAKEPKTPPAAKPTSIFKLAGPIMGATFHPSVNQLLTIQSDKSVKLIDATTGKEIKTLITLPGIPKAYALSRDFSSLAVAIDKTLRIFNTADGKETATIKAPVEITCVAFNADKTKFITGHPDKVARVWDFAKGSYIHGIEHSGPITGVAFSAGPQNVVVASSDKTIAMYPIQQPRGVTTNQPIRSAVLASNGTHLFVGSDDSVVRAFNAGNLNEEKKFEDVTGSTYSIAHSKNGQILAMGGADKKIRLYQFNDAKPIATIPASSVVRCLAFHPNNNIVLAITEDKQMTAWNITHQPGQPLPDEFGTILQQWTLPDSAAGVNIGENGETFVSLADKTVKQYKIALNTPIRNVPGHPNLVDAVAFSPDGKYLASGCHDGLLRVFETEKFTTFKTIQAHNAPAPPAAIYSVTWSPDSKQILTTSFDKSMKLWDVAGGKLIQEFKGFTAKTFERGHEDQVFTATFSKDGKTIFSGSSDRRIKKWNATNGTVIADFANPAIKGEPNLAHPGGIYGLRLTDDGKYLISVGPAPKNKGFVAVWNSVDGKLVSATETNTGPIYSVVLTADGKNIIVGCGPKVRQVPEADAVVLPLPK